MTTTFIDFVPSTILAPSYQITLDGQIYTMTAIWNLYSQRYFIMIADLSGAVILTEALIGSPIGLTINSIAWANAQVKVTTDLPHGLQIGQTLNVTIIGAAPDSYNGLVEAFVTGPQTLTYPLANNPGVATVPGSVQQNIDLVGGLFTTTLVYRTQNSQFEVSP